MNPTNIPIIEAYSCWDNSADIIIKSLYVVTFIVSHPEKLVLHCTIANFFVYLDAIVGLEKHGIFTQWANWSECIELKLPLCGHSGANQ